MCIQLWRGRSGRSPSRVLAWRAGDPGPLEFKGTSEAECGFTRLGVHWLFLLHNYLIILILLIRGFGAGERFPGHFLSFRGVRSALSAAPHSFGRAFKVTCWLLPLSRTVADCWLPLISPCRKVFTVFSTGSQTQRCATSSETACTQYD